MAVSSAEIAAKKERARRRPCPCKLRGVPIPVSARIQTPRLYPQAWINKRFRMFSCPRKYTRRSPPLPYMWAIDRSAFSVRCFPNSRPRSPPTRSRFASTVFWTSSLAVPVALPLRLRHVRLLPVRCQRLQRRIAVVALVRRHLRGLLALRRLRRRQRLAQRLRVPQFRSLLYSNSAGEGSPSHNLGTALP